MYEQLIAELEEFSEVEGLAMSDLLEFPPALCSLLTWMVKSNIVQLEDLGEYLKIEAEAVRHLMELLIGKGMVEEIKKDIDEGQYQVHMKSSRNYRVPKNIWQVFDT